MKTQIKILTVILITSLVTSSCQDATDIEQRGTITQDRVFENVDDLQLGLNGAYAAYSVRDAISFNAIFSDNVKQGKDSNGQNQSLYGYVLNPSSTYIAGSVNPIATVWRNRYATINFCNRVLEGYNSLTFNQDDQAKADNIAGQLIALRSLCHFDLLEYYAESYTDDSALAVPYMDFVPDDINIQPTRNTVGEIYQFINDDLDKANALIKDDNGVFYIGKDAIKAIHARVKLFHGKYAEAQSLADEVLSDHPLANPADYINLFNDTQSQSGAVWTLAKGKDESQIASLFYFNTVEFSGDPFVEVSNGLYNALQEEQNLDDGDPSTDIIDVRQSVLVKPETDLDTDGNLNGSVFVGKNSPDNVLLINKYPGSGSEPLVNDYKIFRSAEMLLIKAESQARQDNLSGAANSIKELLDNRYDQPATLPSYGTKKAALLDIFKQRRFELAYEGHRFLDIKRFRDVTNQGIVRNPVDCESYFTTECDLPKNSYKFVLPIPSGELNANSAIQQNPGY